jgi:hypothetical protein
MDTIIAQLQLQIVQLASDVASVKSELHMILIFLGVTIIPLWGTWIAQFKKLKMEKDFLNRKD